jgi:hypothetical protein
MDCWWPAAKRPSSFVDSFYGNLNHNLVCGQLCGQVLWQCILDMDCWWPSTKRPSSVVDSFYGNLNHNLVLWTGVMAMYIGYGLLVACRKTSIQLCGQLLWQFET